MLTQKTLALKGLKGRTRQLQTRKVVTWGTTWVRSFLDLTLSQLSPALCRTRLPKRTTLLTALSWSLHCESGSSKQVSRVCCQCHRWTNPVLALTMHSQSTKSNEWKSKWQQRSTHNTEEFMPFFQCNYQSWALTISFLSHLSLCVFLAIICKLSKFALILFVALY